MTLVLDGRPTSELPEGVHDDVAVVYRASRRVATLPTTESWSSSLPTPIRVA